MYKIILVLTVSLSNFEIQAQTATTDHLPGTWNMYQVIQQGIDVTKEHNPQQDRWIKFEADGIFKTGGTPYGLNSGTYLLEEGDVLFLDSDAGPDDDSRWKISFEDDQMIWLGLGSEFAEGFELVHKKEQ